MSNDDNLVLVEAQDTKIWTRPGTLDDYVVGEVIRHKCYDRLQIQDIDRVVDIGANIGTFSCFYSKRAYVMFAFEPDVDNFCLLGKNVCENNVEHIKSYNCAVVGNDDSKRYFYLNDKKNKGGHSLYVKRGRTKVAVDCVNINTIIEHCRPTKIKMDCEGAEEEILSAADLSSIQAIIFEYHFNILKDHPNHEKYWTIIGLLKSQFNDVQYLEDPKKYWTTIVFAKKEI